MKVNFDLLRQLVPFDVILFCIPGEPPTYFHPGGYLDLMGMCHLSVETHTLF